MKLSESLTFLTTTMDSVTSRMAKIFLWNTCWRRKPIHHGTTFNGKVTTICCKFEKKGSSWCCKKQNEKEKGLFFCSAWTSWGRMGKMGLFDVIVDVNGALSVLFIALLLSPTGISRISQRDLHHWKYCIFNTHHQHRRGSLITLINGLK